MKPKQQEKLKKEFEKECQEEISKLVRSAERSIIRIFNKYGKLFHELYKNEK